jgi:hypothetical protein
MEPASLVSLATIRYNRSPIDSPVLRSGKRRILGYYGSPIGIAVYRRILRLGDRETVEQESGARLRKG